MIYTIVIVEEERFSCLSGGYDAAFTLRDSEKD